MSWHEDKNPLTEKAPIHQKVATKPLISKSSIKPHFQYENETDRIALERFPISRLKKVGSGSDRIVMTLRMEM